MRVKICGLRARADAEAAVRNGAAYGGLVFFPPSPRHLTLADARWVAESLPQGVIKVALTVDADDATLDAIMAEVPIDMMQLHGQEPPDRVAAVRDRFGLPVMKAVGITDEVDLANALGEYARAADQLLVDALPPRNAATPGGNGATFNWRLVQGRRWSVPWMLAGGLTPDNIAEAVRVTGATQVDVSSGVESRPGIKDPALIAAFLHAAHAAVPAEA